MPEPQEAPARVALGSALRRIRTLNGRPQDGLGDGASKLSQSTVSRIESGRRLPTREQTEAWLSLATAEQRDETLQLLDVAHRYTRTYDEMMAGQRELQTMVGEEDAAAAVVRPYSPIVLPGLLQTAEYAKRVFEISGRTDVPASIAARLQRQAVLHEPGRRFEFLIPQRVLGCDVAPASRAGQLWHLQSAATLENVDVGVVPDAAYSVLAWSGFTLRTPADGSPEYATAELVDGRHTAADESSVEKYRRTFELLSQDALHGEAALQAIRDARL